MAVRVTNEMLYEEIQYLKRCLIKIDTIKWMAGTSLTISVLLVGKILVL